MVNSVKCYQAPLILLWFHNVVVIAISSALKLGKSFSTDSIFIGLMVSCDTRAFIFLPISNEI